MNMEQLREQVLNTKLPMEVRAAALKAHDELWCGHDLGSYGKEDVIDFVNGTEDWEETNKGR